VTGEIGGILTTATPRKRRFTGERETEDMERSIELLRNLELHINYKLKITILR
jgi:hypothetical protein